MEAWDEGTVGYGGRVIYNFPGTVLILIGFLTLLFREFLLVKNSKLFISETLDSYVTLRVFWKL